MAELKTQSPHTFHIPVMGTGYTVDTPLRVARYGISSVISLVDDVLIEQMHKLHSEKNGEPFEAVDNGDKDRRALRITAYLNLVDRLVRRQTEELRASSFDDGEIRRYFELLPDSPLREDYETMLAEADPDEKARRQEELRSQVAPGSIDVNIMTKMNRPMWREGEEQAVEFADALAALRGFANSTCRSSIVFSAGMNPRLYTYLAQFPDFFPDETGELKKKVVLKVSDYRSALIQGKFLAKRGIWVSEYRVESGLNCGGHAFATKGYLMGPILEEFKSNRLGLVRKLHGIYVQTLAGKGMAAPSEPFDVRITAQGGIGTASENQSLLQYYQVDGTGWGTPFLLVPEVANVDDEHLAKLSGAGDGDVYLSDSSPLQVSYWNLRTSASEAARRERIEAGKPGSLCKKGYTSTNTEFSKVPMCLASRAYQKIKLELLSKENLTEALLGKLRKGILAKSCICHDLGGGATLKHGIDKDAKPAICCGPNIAGFSGIRTLEEMLEHIYGKLSIFDHAERPHMFISELSLYIDHLREEVKKHSEGLSMRTTQYYHEFKENLLEGIEYYAASAEKFVDERRERFFEGLKSLRETLEAIPTLVAVS